MRDTNYVLAFYALATLLLFSVCSIATTTTQLVQAYTQLYDDFRVPRTAIRDDVHRRGLELIVKLILTTIGALVATWLWQRAYGSPPPPPQPLALLFH